MKKTMKRSAAAHRANYARLKTAIAEALGELEKLKGRPQIVEELPEKIEQSAADIERPEED